MSVTLGSPFVKVPVLSNMTVASFHAFSTYSPLRRSTPYSAPFPTPARIAVGVAMPKAHGQEINTTANNTKNAVAKLPLLLQTSRQTKWLQPSR